MNTKKRMPSVVAVAPPEVVFTSVSESATFPGGTTALNKFLDQTCFYPIDAKENEIEGVVVVRFVIDEEGMAQHARIIRGLNKSCNDEALRIVRSMPKWKPAKMNGHPVRSVYELPLKFIID